MDTSSRSFYVLIGMISGLVLVSILLSVLDGLKQASIAIQAEAFERGRKAGVAEDRSKEAIYYCRRGMFILNVKGVISDAQYEARQGDCEQDGVPQ